ncbi:MAG: hypothetical protein ABJH45_21335 [Paracoccaceae bacterium]
MFVSKPRGAKDDIVRTAQTRKEAQALAKTSLLIVPNKSKFLPRSGVSVRSRPHVIFDFKATQTLIEMSLSSESDTMTITVKMKRDTIESTSVNASASSKVMTPKRRELHVENLRLAIESLPLLDVETERFTNRVPVLQNNLATLLELARNKLDEIQVPLEEEAVNTAAFQKHLDQVPLGSFVIRRISGYGVKNDTGLVSIHEGLEKLKPRERVYALTQAHSQLLADALDNCSAHARLAAMRLLEGVPLDHPAALPAEVANQFSGAQTNGDVLARLETMKEMSEEETIGEVFLLIPEMINTYSSYRLPYGYTYWQSWEDRLKKSPLSMTKRRSSLPQRPAADLITLDGVLCVSKKAKSALEELDLGDSRFHFIENTGDYWAMEITEVKSGPVPDESLFERNNDGLRTPRPITGTYFMANKDGLDSLTKRARFGADNLNGPDVWICDDFSLGRYKSPNAIMVSEKVVKVLKKAKCKWYKPLHSARVVEL